VIAPFCGWLNSKLSVSSGSGSSTTTVIITGVSSGVFTFWSATSGGPLPCRLSPQAATARTPKLTSSAAILIAADST
jgi:hypothetical protein